MEDLVYLHFIKEQANPRHYMINTPLRLNQRTPPVLLSLRKDLASQITSSKCGEFIA